MTVDLMGIVTALGLMFGAATGGTVVGGGVQVGAVWTVGEGVQVGVTPLVVMETPALPRLGLAGITLGGTMLVATPGSIVDAWRVERDSPGLLRWYREDAARVRRKIMRYEAGHWHGWAAYGVEYVPRLLDNPCAYDPLITRATELRCGGVRAVNPHTLPARHYAVTFSIAGR